MLDFIPWMIVSTVVILLIAGWGAYRSGLLGPGGLSDMERVREAEAFFADCLAEQGFRPLAIKIFRDRTDGELVIVGPPVPDDMISAFAYCDNRVSDLYRRPPAPGPTDDAPY
jgi:hypothetical protein